MGEVGEVYFELGDGEAMAKLLIDADQARELGKALITAGWDAYREKHGAKAMLAHMFGADK